MSGIDQWPVHRPTFSYESLHAEFAALSEEEQRAVLRDRYGRGDEINETPEFISERLKRLKNEIDSIENKEAYDIASFVSPDHVNSDRFCLAFLRADSFDVKAAASRMVSYWERKVDIFGTDKAFNPSISVLDFEERDYPALAGGGCRLLPHLDESGRALLSSFPLYFYDNDVSNMVRLVWFLVHAAVFDKDMADVIQTKGIVILAGNGFAANAPMVFQSLSEAQRFSSIVGTDMLESLPVRCRSHHHFLPNEIGRYMVEHLLQFIDPRWRHRMTFYNGQDFLQNRSALLRCGIKPEIIPLELGGDLHFNYQQWVNDRISEDLATSVRSTSSTTSENNDDEIRQRAASMDKLRVLLQSFRTKEVLFLQSMARSISQPPVFS